MPQPIASGGIRILDAPRLDAASISRSKPRF
jgi:hypothetical protein